LTKFVALVADEEKHAFICCTTMMEHHCKLGAYRGQSMIKNGEVFCCDSCGDLSAASIDCGAIHMFDSSVKKSFVTILVNPFSPSLQRM
jgi:hypothetical protein